MDAPEPPFSLPPRFQLGRYLGEGGMGCVFQAVDQENGRSVAVKFLHSRHMESLALFKNEFRSLQDMHHPNLVQLGDLAGEGERWFFTMELVDGVHFLEYVRGPDENAGSATTPEMPPAL